MSCSTRCWRRRTGSTIYWVSAPGAPRFARVSLSRVALRCAVLVTGTASVPALTLLGGAAQEHAGGFQAAYRFGIEAEQLA